MISDRRRRRRHRQDVARALRRKELRRNKRESVRNRVKQFTAARWLTGWFGSWREAAEDFRRKRGQMSRTEGR